MADVAYLIGKIRDVTPAKEEENIQYAARVAADLWRDGIYCIVPHLNSYHAFLEYGNDITWDQFLIGDEEIIKRVDYCIALENWQASPGGQREIKFTEKLGKKLYFWPDVPTKKGGKS